MDQIPFTSKDSNGEPLRRLPLMLYKYRSLEPFDRIEDILLKKRFYAARLCELRLKDSMEGRFAAPQVHPSLVKQIRSDAEQWRVCSFSETANNVHQWHYYADAFKGICIEIEIQTPAPFEWEEVKYPLVSRCMDIPAEYAELTRLFPQRTLGWKTKEFTPEDEVRICTKTEYVPLGNAIRMTRIFLGLRTPAPKQDAIRKIIPDGVSLWTTKISEDCTIQVDKQI
jgi:hypothetical protein